MSADRELNETAVKLQLLESSRVSAWNSVLYLPSLADIVLAQNIIVFTMLGMPSKLSNTVTSGS